MSLKTQIITADFFNSILAALDDRFIHALFSKGVFAERWRCARQKEGKRRGATRRWSKRQSGPNKPLHEIATTAFEQHPHHYKS